eukprot:1773989-Prymnesium_polylepis.1
MSTSFGAASRSHVLSRCSASRFAFAAPPTVSSRVLFMLARGARAIQSIVWLRFARRQGTTTCQRSLPKLGYLKLCNGLLRPISCAARRVDGTARHALRGAQGVRAAAAPLRR